jgi:ribonucleoside-diphosphate reductase alpha chain
LALTDFGIATLADRYYWKDERSPDDLFKRVSNAYGSNPEHAGRILSYLQRLWFMPATPILSNGGTDRGLPISCFLNTVPDSMEGIRGIWNENVELAKNGGGIGTNWSDVRSVGESVAHSGTTSGIIPFVKVMDSLTLAISQGSLRRGSAAVYLDVWHPEIEEFLEIRKPSGDVNRRSLNIHHGVNISDAFMWALKTGAPWHLFSPKTGEIVKTVNAREIWQRILELRIETGEPYLNFIDTVNAALPDNQRELGLTVRQSNLCTEITLPTNEDRTAVCCLSSINVSQWNEIKDYGIEQFVKDIAEFLDNVLTDFANRTTIDRARFSVLRERAIGVGVMGLHTFFQQNGIPFASVMAKVWNKKIFKELKQAADKASKELANERGSCPDVPGERFSHKLAIAPTANISVICGGVSAGIEPIPANVYIHKTLSGSFVVRNPNLEKIIGSDPEIWEDILKHDGSVQHLEMLSDLDKDVYKTAFEIDQRWIVELAADRADYLCQSQSVNLFLPPDIHKQALHDLHWAAWAKGVKSLYYVRSKTLQRATNTTVDGYLAPHTVKLDPEECLACQ